MRHKRRSGRRASRATQAEPTQKDRWLVSYADFITLLFAFFTSMYAISTVDAKKAGKMVFSTRAAFNTEFFPSDQAILGLSSMAAPPPVDGSNIAQQQFVRPVAKGGGSHEPPPPAKTVKRLAKELDAYVKKRKLDGQLDVRMKGKRLVVSLSEVGFFKPGTAKIRQRSLRIIDRIAKMVLRQGGSLRVEGHTDDRPARHHAYPTNWHLSTARAVTVINYLQQEFAFPPENLAAVGYAGYRPLVSNDSAKGRSQNRRVDLVIGEPEDSGE